MRRTLLLLVALLVSACGGEKSETATPPTSAEVLATGAYAVGVTTIHFIDASRPTMANGSFPGSAERRLSTEIWYPAAADERDAALDTAGGRYPLLVYSHGFSDQRIGAGYLARHLASHGYVVAAPDFPLTSLRALGGQPNGADLINQPGDVRFVIDSLLADEAPNRFAVAIDAERIALAGLSFGGLTTSLTTFHPMLRDPRVRAAVSIAGSGCFFNQSFYQNAAVPWLLVHGDLDAIVPYGAHAVFGFGQARTPKYLATLVGGTHTAFTEFAAQLFEDLPNADEVGCLALGLGDPEDDGGGEGNGDLLEQLGGAEAGLFAGDCPAACRMPRPFPAAMRPSRQRQLAVLAIFPFLEAELRGREEMRTFLEQRAAEENADLVVEFAR